MGQRAAAVVTVVTGAASAVGEGRRGPQEAPSNRDKDQEGRVKGKIRGARPVHLIVLRYKLSLSSASFPWTSR